MKKTGLLRRTAALALGMALLFCEQSSSILMAAQETEPLLQCENGTLFHYVEPSKGKDDGLIDAEDMEEYVISYRSDASRASSASSASGEKEFTIQSTENDKVKNEILLLLDVSESMRGTPLEQLKKACYNFIDDIFAEDAKARIGIVTYESNIKAYTFDDEYFTNDCLALYDVISSLKVGGSTGMNGGYLKCNEIFQIYSNSSRHFLVHMADGCANVGDSDSSSDARYAGSEFHDLLGNPFTYTSSSAKNYASAVYNTAASFGDMYYTYSLGFFHGISGTTRQFCSLFMNDIQNSGYYEVDNADELSFSFEGIASNIKQTYVVKFHMNGKGTAIDSQTVTEGELPVEPVPAEVDGYYFGGWYTDAACTKAYNFASVMKKDLTLYAKWIPKETETFSVTFETEHGRPVASQTVQKGELAHKPSDLSAAGFEFIDWYTDKDFTTRFRFSTPVTSNLTLYARWEESIVFSLKDYKAAIPNTVPILGGGEVELDLDSLPVDCAREGDTYRIGINLADARNLKDPDEWNALKKAVEDAKNAPKSFADAKKAAAKMGFDTDGEITAFGYAEGTYTNGKFTKVGGKVIVIISGSLEKQWQTAVWVIPVVVKLTGEASATGNLAIGYDITNAKLYGGLDGEFIIPEITVSGGVGIAYMADVSGYGALEHKLKASLSDGTQLSLGGELGVSATLFGHSYTKPILSNKSDPWVYYTDKASAADSAKSAALSVMGTESASGSTAELPAGMTTLEEFAEGMKDSGNYSLDTAPAAKQGEASASLMAISSTPSGNGLLSSDIYDDADPILVETTDGTRMMFFLDFDTSRTAGNQTALYYSIYDAVSGNWSPQAIVEDDGTADLYPSVSVDGNEVYVAWTDNRSKLSVSGDSITLQQSAAEADITVAQFRTSMKKFTCSSICTDAFADMKPQISVKNGIARLVWLSLNSEDLLKEHAATLIRYADNSAGTWSVPQIYATYTQTVSNLSVGTLGGKAYLTYLLDSNKKEAASADAEIYCGEWGEGKTPKAFTSNYVREMNGKFATLGGEEVFIWQENGTLRYSKDMRTQMTLSGASNAIAGDFQIVHAGSEDIILYVTAANASTQLAGCVYHNSVLGDPVILTGTASFMNSFSALATANGFLLAYTKSDYKMSGSGDSLAAEQITKLYLEEVKKNAKLSLDDVQFSQDDVVPGADLPMECTVSNTGMSPVNGYTITVSAGEKTLCTDETAVKLNAGETRTVPISVELPADFAANTELTVSVEAKEGSVTEVLTKSKSVTAGYPDLELTAETGIDSKNNTTISGVVKNLSAFPASATLVIRKTNEKGKALYKKKLGTIAKGSSQKISLSAKEVAKFASNDNILYVSVVCKEKEYYTVNNYAYLVASDVLSGVKKEYFYAAAKVSLSKTSYVYDGKVKTPTVTVKNALGTKLKEGTNYTVTLAKGRKAVGSYEVTVKLKGGYSGTVKTTFKIVPKGTTLSKLAKDKKTPTTLVITWKAQKSQTTGYELAYSTSKKFEKANTKNLYVSKNTTVTKNVKKLKSKTTYYVRIRTYQTVSVDGKSSKLYSSWSKTEKIKL